MKTISMDYDKYQEELWMREMWGQHSGMTVVLDFLDNDETFADFYLKNKWIHNDIYSDIVTRLKKLGGADKDN